jgi:hypothetical protein
LVLLSLVSCDTQLTNDLNQTNPNELVEERYYQNGQQLETAVNAIYQNFHVTGMYKRRKFFIYDTLPGVVAPTAAAESWIPALIGWNHGAGNSGLTLHWNSLYQGIKRANLVIEKAPDVEEGITESERQELVAQARFLRAFHYYKLVALWGDVPLVDEVKREPGGEPLASTQDVYSFIESDLEFAIDNLPASYGEDDVGRATSVAAEALMGRMELDRENYGSAQRYFESIVNNGVAQDGGQLQLVDNYFDNYKEETENNSESIFEIQFAEGTGNDWFEQGGDGANQTFRNQEYGFLQWRNVIASENVLDEMGVQGTDQVGDIEDERATSTWYFACDTYANESETYTTATHDCGTGLPPEDRSTGDDIPSWKKYQVYYREAREGFVANSGINWREIRYAEVLLGLAEAYIQQGNLTDAVDLVDQVRTTHTDLSAYGSFGSEQEAMDALYHEHVMEFTGDPTLYHFLKRYPSYLEQLNPNAFEPYLMPIPREEIDNNPEIESSVNQERGY